MGDLPLFGSVCSGSFLRPGLIITADHCKSDKLHVRSGVNGFNHHLEPNVLEVLPVEGSGNEHVDLKLIKVSKDYNPKVDVEILSDCNQVNGLSFQRKFQEC